MTSSTEFRTRTPLSDEPSFFAPLRSLYEELHNEIARLGPVCELSGRCCRFREHGHTLFVSTPEFEYFLASAPEPQRPLDEGDTCPWQNQEGRCTARDCRPLGCRVYFCDQAYLPSAYELSERFIIRLKRLATQHEIPWNYVPLHHHLQTAVATQRIALASDPFHPG
jgi:hypothetical protein